jgi:hypothetical protein
MFHLVHDADEQVDLVQEATDPTAGLQDWMRAVYSGLNRLDATVPDPLDEESIRRLRSLGYAD